MRELQEEIGIQKATIKAIHSQQSMNESDGKAYFNVYYEVSDILGTILNAEPDKCSELVFYSLRELRDERVVPYVYRALESIEQ